EMFLKTKFLSPAEKGNDFLRNSHLATTDGSIAPRRCKCAAGTPVFWLLSLDFLFNCQRSAQHEHLNHESTYARATLLPTEWPISTTIFGHLNSRVPRTEIRMPAIA